MKQLPSQEVLRGLFSYQDGRLLRLTAGSNGKHAVGSEAGYLHRTGYRYVEIDGSAYLTHRLIWKLVKGSEPGPLLDHIDENPLNNRIENLQQLDKRGNAAKSKRRADLPTGVERRGQRFRSRAYIDGRYRSLGTYDTPEQAHQAYLEAIS